MKASSATLLLVLLASCSTPPGGRWITVSDGFRFSIPEDWRNQHVVGDDSHVGEYIGKNAYLEFDDVGGGVGYTAERTQAVVDRLRAREANPKLLKSGEEIWHVDGRIADFSAGKADPVTYGVREFENVATLFVPYENQVGYLQVLVFYRDDGQLPTVLRILKSIEWKK